ncbi:ABC transporter permease [Pseudogemmobacter hezensis]|uniref:ABC transporter permease n=1 Tax=Pseudogemmobacter hezensis TaxID=2737662 RepID=UPI001C130C49|nr:ABC transporter permease [Pseudogemmobacter hezensis]
MSDTLSLPGRRARIDALSFGLILSGLVVAAALAAPLVAWVTGHGPTDQFRTTGLDQMGLPMRPNAEFLLGSDGFGRDVLVRVLYGTRISLIVGLPATTLAMLVGTLIGLVAGWSRGWGDQLFGRFMDVMIAFPFILTALSLATINRGADGQPRIPPEALVVLVIAGFSWIYFARLVRGITRSLRDGPLVNAARVSGASVPQILWREVLPVILPKIAVFWSVQLPANIVAEATLSFLGVGINPPTPSLGNMIADAQRSGLYQVQPWLLLGPGLALFLAVAGANILSAGLRSRLDPHSALRV